MNDIRDEDKILPQTNSPLFRLPGELRNWIYDLVITPSAPIVNPSWETTTGPKHQQVPSLGVTLLRTCRAVYLEANESTLLRKGDFVFTRIAHIQAFFSRLSLSQRSNVDHITIDLREAASGDPASQSEESTTIANEWVHYFCCVQGAHMMGAWCADLSTLKNDIPHLRSICIDLTTWQPNYAGARVSGWRYLQSLLRSIRGLDFFTLKGKRLDSSSWRSPPVPWSLGLWVSPAFDKDESALVDLLGHAIREPKENEVKLLEWHVVEGGVTLLTVRVDEAHKIMPLTGSDLHLLYDGRMLWNEFLDFKENQVESIKRRKASMSIGDAIWGRAPEVLV
ncbi:hypothetical protein D6D19_02764 [Aureobasidium pullulans]|uniref:Uncharacterized protein n=1 Tax=Aureobasidium pullulans TaxID=5580 RepID=A0A4S9AC67_AURPU|nr:hypothetical protein D6D23_03780 [Aureobasidium pullulans]THW76846.1 hypothetical protein D6D19_02764 [Aureobasidium pullulans]THZ75143.1 hypothetical protein D6C85_03060 [Aureobasidium pullulans]TIA22158.1 hypothetical protein D6C81_03433 [Aureobasidium pullulans]